MDTTVNSLGIGQGKIAFGESERHWNLGLVRVLRGDHRDLIVNRDTTDRSTSYHG